MPENRITLYLHIAAAGIWKEACFPVDYSLRQCAAVLLEKLMKEESGFVLSEHTLFYDIAGRQYMNPDIPLSLMNAEDTAVIEIC